MYQLALALPYNSDLHFNIYMDNYFPSILLLEKLRDIGIGACGTARVRKQYFLPTFTIIDRVFHRMKFLEDQQTLLEMFWLYNRKTKAPFISFQQYINWKIELLYYEKASRYEQ